MYLYPCYQETVYMMSSAGSAHTYRSEGTRAQTQSHTLLVHVWLRVSYRSDLLSLPGQWEESELEAVHGGADLVPGQ